MVRYNPQVENPFLRRGTSFTPTFLSNLGIIFLLGLLVYMNSLGGGFVYDDYAFIVNNPHIKTLSHPGRFFLLKTATSFSGHSIWRPLRTLSFAFDYHLWGLEPFGYHLTNVLFHIINGVLVYIIILRLGLAWRVALISSCLFLVHPLQTESVSWISSRGDCLFAAFFLLSLYWYMKGRIILSYLSFILSLFSKETALSLPLLLLAYDSLFIRPQFAEKRKNNITPSCQRDGFFTFAFLSKPRLRWYAGFLAISLGYLVCRYLVLGEFAQRGWWGGSFFVTANTMVKVFGIYLRLLFLPTNLRLIYEIPLSYSFFTPSVLFSAFLLVCLAVATLLTIRRAVMVSFSILWFFILMLPVSNILPIVGGVLCEHYLYLALVGFCLLVALGMEELYRSGKVRTLLFPVILVGAYSLATVERNQVWQSNLTLWSDAAAKEPHSAKAIGGLAQGYMDIQRYDLAERECRRALAIDPYEEGANYNLGLLCGYRGAFAESIFYFKRVLVYESYYTALAHNNIAVSYMGLNPPRPDLAWWHLERARKLGYTPHQDFVAQVKKGDVSQ